MNSKDRYLLKLNVARAYYMDKLTQIEIAEKLNISRPTLIKLLKEALEEGIVRIEVIDIQKVSELMEIENQLKTVLDLRDVKIVDVKNDTTDAINAGVGRAAAEYLSTLIKSNMQIGIGWGRTIEIMARNMSSVRNVRNVNFIPVMGGPGSSENCSMFANNLCEKIAGNFSGSSIDYIYAPFFVEDRMMRNAYMSLPNVKVPLEKLDALDMAVIGIDGDMEHSTTIDIDKEIAKKVTGKEKSNFAGNICARFFDADGNRILTELDENVIAITPRQLSRTPTVVGVAGGRFKVDSIIGGAKAGMYNILVTDVFTAEKILAKL